MMTRVLILITAALALAFAGALAPPEAAAQPAPGAPGVQLVPAPAAQPSAAQPAAADPAPRAAVVDRDPRLNPPAPPHLDELQSTGKGMALLFWAFALAAVGGAVFVITRRNLIAAVMGMVGSFLGIAAVYMMLYASFAVGVAAMLYLVFRLAMLLVNVRAPEEAMGPPRPVLVTVGAGAPNAACDPARCESVGGRCATVAPNQPQVCRVEHEWGSVRAVGTDLFGPGVFPFEAISILLLVAVVGAIAIARPLHEDPKPEGEAGGAP